MLWENQGWTMGFGWIFMIIFWILVIFGIVYLIQIISKGSKKEDTETALDILKKRYAKGEITREEFEGMKNDLKKG